MKIVQRRRGDLAVITITEGALRIVVQRDLATVTITKLKRTPLLRRWVADGSATIPSFMRRALALALDGKRWAGVP